MSRLARPQGGGRRDADDAARLRPARLPAARRARRAIRRPILGCRMNATSQDWPRPPSRACGSRPWSAIELDRAGARGNRAFCVIDDRGRMVNAKSFAQAPDRALSSYDLEAGELALTFPDGRVTGDRCATASTLTIRFFSQPCAARLVLGPWAEALSDFIGEPLRLVEPEVGVDRGRDGGGLVISRASVRASGRGRRDGLGRRPAFPDADRGRRRRRRTRRTRGSAARSQIGPARWRCTATSAAALITSRDPETADGRPPDARSCWPATAG